MDEMIQSIKKALNNPDLKFKPYALLIHPFDKVELLKRSPELEERLVIFPTGMAPRGTAYLVDREDFVQYLLHPSYTDYEMKGDRE